MRMHNPPHPGLILKDALAGIPMSVTEFADYIGVARVTVSRIVNRRSGISAPVSIKLSEAFGQDQPDLWFKLQNDYDFWKASRARHRKIAPLALSTQEAA